MVKYYKVQGSKKSAEPLIVNVDTVYVHTNIKNISTEEFPDLYEYDEIQYDKNEFIELITKLGEQNTQDIQDTQIGLTEAYEYTDGAYSEVTDLQNAVVELYEMILGGDL